MVFLFLGILIVIFAVRCCSTGDGELVLPSILFATIVLMPLLFGLHTYPMLLGRHAKVVSFKNEVETIRNAHYKETTPGNLVGGSLDNIKQSSILSEYISEYAEEKAQFNRRLVETKAKLDNPIFWWLGCNLTIDKRVKQIEVIK